MRINTGNTAYIYKKIGGYRAFITAQARRLWELLPNWEVDKQQPPIYAWVCNSAWVCTCEDCNNQYIVEPSDPVWFCPNCMNRNYGLKARQVIFPKDIRKIEEILVKRVNPATRNWIATPDIGLLAYGKPQAETLADLIDQNKAAGEFE